MQEDDNIFSKPSEEDDNSTEATVFRILEAEGAKAQEEAPESEDQPEPQSVQSDFASDFADPSLMYHPPAAEEPIADETDQPGVDDTDETSYEMTESLSEDEQFSTEGEVQGEVEDPDVETSEEYEVLETEDVGDAFIDEPMATGRVHDLSEKPEGNKPIICLMGEFSAGKSTLSNLLIGTNALPVNVTATQLPPVWISKGSDAPYRVGLDGHEYEVSLDNLEAVSVADTAYIRIFHEADLLDDCDLIDMPGISDPNMDAEVWQRVVHFADSIIWCSHATQAWRQSEAAVWSMLPSELYADSLLLLTRVDKILSDRDKMRVAKRVGRETVDLFRELFPISLTRALAGKDDPAKWEASGAEHFMSALQDLIAEISARKAGDVPATQEFGSDEPARVVMPSRVRPKPLGARRPTSRTTSTPAPLPPL